MTATPHDARLARVRERMADAGISALFLAESADLEYLTGMPRAHHELDRVWDPYEMVQGCFVGVENGPLFLFSETQWAGEAAATAAAYETRQMPLDGDPVEWLRDAGGAIGVDQRLAVSSWTPFRQIELLRQALPSATFVEATDLILPLRLSKDESEIACMRESAAIAKRAIEATLGHFGTSFRRGDFLAELREQALRAGADGIGYGPDLYAAGPTTAIDWFSDCVGMADAPINAPAAVSIDFGVIYRGYRSDIGRTFFVGQPPEASLAALNVVREAQAAAIATLRPGLPAEEVDATSRGIMEAAGLGDAFSIPSGHGIGLEVHEPPRFRLGDLQLLTENAVVCVEIAAWRLGTLSAFWEDEVVVRSSGPERLTDGPSEAYVIG